MPKEIIHESAIETTKVIIEDLNNNFFSILINESRDVSNDNIVTTFQNMKPYENNSTNIFNFYF